MSNGGTIAGRYRLEQVLGRGGQATVHRALDLKTGKHVAVKELDGLISHDPTVVARLAREQQAMLALAGTHAVEVIELCHEPGGPLCLVMELLEGETLEAHLTGLERERRVLPVARVISIMQPVVETLDTAHAVGIVHRDLKPENIFLLNASRGGGTRLLDFGLARLLSSEALTAVGTVMGSPSYIAPESWAGLPGRLGTQADVYALSVILFRMLGGRMPFVGKTLLDKMKNATRAERPSLYELRNELPPQVDIWVERALAVDPNDRFASAGACFGELLWALKLAAHPSQEVRLQLSQQQAEEVKQWLASEAQPDSLPAPLLSLEPTLLSSVAPDNATSSSEPEEIPFISVEPAPLSQGRTEQRSLNNIPAGAPVKALAVLPPIPKAPALPDQDISQALSRSPERKHRAPSVVPERSEVRAHDDWDDATMVHNRALAAARVHRK